MGSLFIKRGTSFCTIIIKTFSRFNVCRSFQSCKYKARTFCWEVAFASKYGNWKTGLWTFHFSPSKAVFDVWNRCVWPISNMFLKVDFTRFQKFVLEKVQYWPFRHTNHPLHCFHLRAYWDVARKQYATQHDLELSISIEYELLEVVSNKIN